MEDQGGGSSSGDGDAGAQPGGGNADFDADASDLREATFVEEADELARLVAAIEARREFARGVEQRGGGPARPA